MPSNAILEQKKQVVADLAEQIKASASGVVVNYQGITVDDDTKMRKALREAGVKYKVVKNSLTGRACDEVGFGEMKQHLVGMTAIAISENDAVAPAKVLSDFAKDVEALEIKAGFLDGKVISIDEVKQLASTPSREVLIAKIMGSLNAPISKLVRTLQALVDNGVEPADIKVEAPAAEEAAAPAEEAPAAE